MLALPYSVTVLCCNLYKLYLKTNVVILLILSTKFGDCFWLKVWRVCFCKTCHWLTSSFLLLSTAIHFERKNTTFRSLSNACFVFCHSTFHFVCLQNDKYYLLWWKILTSKSVWYVSNWAMSNNKHRRFTIITFYLFIRKTFSGKQWLFMHPKWIQHQTGTKHSAFKK